MRTRPSRSAASSPSSVRAARLRPPRPRRRPRPSRSPSAKPEPSPRPQQAGPAGAAARAPAAPAPQAAPAAAPTVLDEANGTPYVTPLVRKLASENGIDLNSLKGTGVGGRIRKQDVLAAAEAKKAPAPAPAAAPAAGSGRPHRRPGRGRQLGHARHRAEANRGSVRSSRSARVESLQTSAQLTQVFEVDVTKIARLRTQAKKAFEAREGVKLTFLPFFAKAAVEALKAAPEAQRVDQRGAQGGHLPRCRAPRSRGRHRARPAQRRHPQRR